MSALGGVRFAPSPTGRFHIGNLRTAWVSRAWSRALGLPWVVRFEDIDRPRVLPGAQDEQLSDLRALGLEPDEVIIQSSRAFRHLSLFEEARSSGAIYPCYCSRKEIQRLAQQSASAPHLEPPIYDGRCRNLSADRGGSPHPTIAWRFRGADPGGAMDFIVGRTEASGGAFSPAYNWACAIDDYDGAYDLLVRAWDLGHVLSQQRAIHSWIARMSGDQRRFPAVFHTSLLVQEDGHRLEKRTQGVTLQEWIARGLTPGQLVVRFGRSIQLDRMEFSPEKVWGEARQTLRLRELIGI